MAITTSVRTDIEIPSNAQNIRRGAHEDWLYDTHVGCVLRIGEENHYDDSDFVAFVWDTEKQAPVKITYATTRFYTYDCSASVDATEETLAQYKAYVDAICDKDKKRSADRVEKHKRVFAKCGALEGTYETLYGRLSGPQLDKIVKLLKTNPAHMKSTFRSSVRAQVILWLHDDLPKYEVPLTRSQMSYL